MALFGSSVEVTPAPNGSTFVARVVTVVTAGTPVQGPAFTIEPGFAVAVRADGGNQAKILFVAPSSADAIDATKRVSLRKLESIALKVDNVSDLWFDGSANNTSVEILVEQL